ncbi:MAG: hypothetical protein JHC95_10500, partial [Solirubrobacteraceae bacterium]|nr:hypothetical protein [Solirubrobacteraceae bacterium]
MTPKLDTASTLERIFETYSRQFAVLLPTALIIFLPVAALQVAVGTNVGLLILALLLTFVATQWYSGVVVLAVRDLQDGKRDFSVGQLISASLPFLGPLLGAGVLYGLGLVAGFILLLIPGLILLTIWAVIAPVIVIEGSGIGGAFSRSQALVKGNGWRVFGVLIVMGIITFLAQQIFASIGRGIADEIGAGVGFLIAVTLTAPLSALTAATLYYTLLGMSEGVPATPDPPLPDPP